MTSSTSKKSVPRKRKSQIWGIGDIFLIPLSDASFACGQVLAAEPLTLKNGPLCAFFAHRLSETSSIDIANSPPVSTLVAVQFVTRDLLDSGVWEVFAKGPPLPYQEFVPDLQSRRAGGFIGTKVIGSGILKTLMEAWFGLYPWDGFADPEYFDKLLVKSAEKPASLRRKH